MQKKPIFIILVSFVYMSLPIFYYLQVAYFERVHFWMVGTVLAKANAADWILAILSVVVGFCIYKVRLFGYYVFMGHALGILGWNIFLAVTHHNYPKVHLIIFSAITFAIIGLFLRKNIRTPYYNPRMRWWEQEKRFNIKLPTIVTYQDNQNNSQGLTYDISASGIFFNGDIEGPVSRKVDITIDYGDMSSFNLEGEVVWITGETARHPKGGGIRFLNMDKGDRKKLRASLKDIDQLGKKFKEEESMRPELS